MTDQHSDVFSPFRWLAEKWLTSIWEFTEYVINPMYNSSKPKVESQSMFSSIIAFLSILPNNNLCDLQNQLLCTSQYAFEFTVIILF